MRVTTIAGSGMHRGLDLGREHAAEIASTVTALKGHLAATGHPPGPLAERLATSGLVRTAERLTPDLWDEVRAMATGARVPLEDVLLLTFLDEVWGLTRSAGCSVMARVMDGRPGEPPTPPTTEIGQTMDLPPWTVGRAEVLRIGTERAPAALVLAYPGSIGLCGANDAGLGVAVNALTRAPLSTDGLGVAFITRHLLTLTTLSDAEAYLVSVPHAAGQAYTVAAPDGIATFEADAESVQRVTPPGTPAIIHTNHRLAPDRAEERVSESSSARLQALMGCLERHTPLADALTGDVVVDGEKWSDPHLTFGAFRAVGSETHARFIDGVDIRAGRREWSRFTFV